MEEKEEWRLMKYYRSNSGTVETIKNVEVSNKGRFRYLNTKSEINIIRYKDHVYPKIKITLSLNNRKSFMVHVAIASTFLDVPEKKGLQVDHIDRDANNFKLNNLRFVTAKENGLNRNYSGKSKIFIVFNGLFEIVTYIKTDNIQEKDWAKIYKNLIKYKQNGFIICQFSKEFYDLVYIDNKFNLNKFLEYYKSEWKIFRNNWYISNYGIIMKITSLGILFTLGSKIASGYFVVNSDLGSERVHRLVIRAFLRNFKPIPDNYVIDHIDGNKENNNLQNLRMVLQEENMRNEITIEKLSIPIKCFSEEQKSWIYFKSSSEAARIFGFGIKTSTIYSWVVGNNRSTLEGFANFSKLSNEEISKLKEGILNFITKKDEIKFPEYSKIKSARWYINSSEDVNKFINSNKITSASDFQIRFLAIYSKASKNNWLSQLKYYSEKDENLKDGEDE